ncbi:hypothetical protein ACQEUX_08065 [Micromonospora sp. CA-259024]|uniref:hypothetical protein n=1 Tax=Micromonospora sp. CA-259024 TaxID=3239965 RepID=UPI003D8F5C05
MSSPSEIFLDEAYGKLARRPALDKALLVGHRRETRGSPGADPGAGPLICWVQMQDLSWGVSRVTDVLRPPRAVVEVWADANDGELGIQ